jgi:hypothetical protein
MVFSKVWSFKNGHVNSVFDLLAFGLGLSVTFDFDLRQAGFSFSAGPLQVSGAYGY